MSSSQQPKARRVWISGASSGLGAAMAVKYLSAGADVWGTARDPARLGAFEGRAGFHPLTFDLAGNPGASFAAQDDTAGGFDVVVNNAGFGVFSPFESAGPAVWEGQLSSMIQGSVAVAHEAMRRFRGRGTGVLVNVSSMAAEFPLPFMSGYNVAKAALSALSESLIFETAGSRIVVIDFRPGDYRTAFNTSTQLASAKASQDPRVEKAWAALESHLARSPEPTRAADDLFHAVERGRSGIVRSGDFFQTRIAPVFAGLASARLRRVLTARYFGVQ